MTTISLIVPVYNHIDFLSKCLASVKNQTKLPDELIIADDGSEEEVLSFLKEFRKTVSFPIIFVQQQHKKFRLAKSRNNAIKNSSGDYLIFCDQDKIMTRELIQNFYDLRNEKNFFMAHFINTTEEQGKHINENNIADFSFLDLLETEQKKYIRKRVYKDKLYYYLHKIYLKPFASKLIGGNFAIFRDTLLKINGFDEMYQGWGHEDDDISNRLYRTGITGLTVPEENYAVHLYHPFYFTHGKKLDNQDYYDRRKKEIRAGDVKCKYGIDNPLENEEIKVIKL